MTLKFLVLLVMMGAMTMSCSSKKNTVDILDDSEVITEVEEIDDEDFIVDDEEFSSEIVSDSVETVEELEESGLSVVEGDQGYADQGYVDTTVASSMPVNVSNEMGEYTLGANETLMMASFKIYGDYRRWKSLRSLNGFSSGNVPAGTVIKYYAPETNFSWNPEGTPYLIKRGDTLEGISLSKYGTYKRWRNIFENNRPLIKDPNLIFAGFTIYYPNLRDVASQQ